MLNIRNHNLDKIFNFCPKCSSTNILIHHNKKIICNDCNLEYYHNVASSTALILENNNRILFLIRNKDPKKGFLDLPGGFVEPNETAEQGIIREVKEELGKTIKTLTYLGSYPNDYEYKNINYSTCDLVFLSKTEHNLFNFNQDEIKSIIWIEKKDIIISKIAFKSLQEAVRKYVSNN